MIVKKIRIQKVFNILKIIFKIFIYLLAFLSLCCCVGFPVAAEFWGKSLIAVHRLLIAMASPFCRSPGVQASCSCGTEHRLSSCEA